MFYKIAHFKTRSSAAFYASVREFPSYVRPCYIVNFGWALRSSTSGRLLKWTGVDHRFA